jgi:thiosulfate/3-mercaptopyruvate sulfurtransferase
MKNYIVKALAACLVVFSFAFTLQQEPVDPWKPAQVIKTADLAKTLNDPKGKKPVIINVGPMGLIKGAVATGAVHDDMGKFKTEVTKYKKDQEIVVYCGCCTMQNCPNIRVAFQHLLKEGYKNPRVLAIETGFTEDWSGKGYPVN